MTTTLQNQPSFGITGGHTPAVDILPNSKPPEPVPPAAAQTFFCYGHLTDLPIEKQSANKDFCTDCWEIVRAERSRDKSTDRWEGEIFVHYEKRYTVRALKIPDNKQPYSIEFKTICLGPVNVPTTAKIPTTPQKDSVTTLPVTQSTSPNVKCVSVTTENCLFCGKPLMKRRRNKLFCNAFCRVRYSRTKDGGKCLVESL